MHTIIAIFKSQSSFSYNYYLLISLQLYLPLSFCKSIKYNIFYRMIIANIAKSSIIKL